MKTSIGYRLAYWQEKIKEDELQDECIPKSEIKLMNTGGKRLENKSRDGPSYSYSTYNYAKIQGSKRLIRENRKYVLYSTSTSTLDNPKVE